MLFHLTELIYKTQSEKALNEKLVEFFQDLLQGGAKLLRPF